MMATVGACHGNVFDQSKATEFEEAQSNHPHLLVRIVESSHRITGCRVMWNHIARMMVRGLCEQGNLGKCSVDDLWACSSASSTAE